MKTMIIAAGMAVAVALFALTLPAAAAPSLQGPTGLLVTPTAETLNASEYNAAFFTFEMGEGNDARVLAANLGLSRGAEVGFANIRPDYGSSETILNAKWRFQAEQGGKPALAVGVIDLGDEIDMTAYLVASMPLSKVLEVSKKGVSTPRLHVGIGGGMLDGLFAGVSVVVAERWTLMAEYDTEDLNLGARYALQDGIRLHAGWIDGLDNFALGISLNKTY